MVYRWYCTLSEARRASRITTTDPNAELMKLIASASRWIEKECGGNGPIRTFIPYLETKKFDFKYAWHLDFWDDLLEVESFTNGDGTVWAVGDYFLYPENERPYRWMEPNYDNEPFAYDNSMQQALTIVGKWGYCDQYVASGDSVQNAAGLAKSAVLLRVNDSDNFSIGMTLLIEDEAMFVSTISGNELTVVRGDNGTEDVAHAKDTAIYVYDPPVEINLAAKILCSRWYQREAAAWTEGTGIPESGFMVTGMIPTEVAQILGKNTRFSFS